MNQPEPPQTSLDERYFENVYASSDDPWHFATSDYEAAKYAATIDILGDERFGRALEIGCSIGVLTERLAERCDELVAVDINEKALASARNRNDARHNIRFARMTVPHDMPEGRFDLVVLSEVGYYWSDDDLERAKTRIAACAPNGIVELVHFLPKVREYVRDGDAVHAAFRIDRRFEVLRSARADRYRIDVLRVA